MADLTSSSPWTAASTSLVMFLGTVQTHRSLFWIQDRVSKEAQCVRLNEENVCKMMPRFCFSPDDVIAKCKI